MGTQPPVPAQVDHTAISLTCWAVCAGRPTPRLGPRMPPPRLFPRLHCWHGLPSRNTGRFMGRNLIGAAVVGAAAGGGSRLSVAPSQARGDCGVTPSVCLPCSRHPPSPERATCPRRPPTHLSLAGLAPPTRCCPAPRPQADATGPGRLVLAAGSPAWGAPFTVRGLPPSARPHLGRLAGVLLVCLRSPCRLPRKEDPPQAEAHGDL